MELNKIKNNIDNHYYTELLKVFKKHKKNSDFIESKLKDIKNDEESITETEITEKIESEKNKKIVFSEDYHYKKSWNKLSLVHKNIKAKEFVSKLMIKNNDDKKKLEKTIIKLIKEKKLTKKDKVNYDSVNGRIISIPDLIHVNGNYFIKI